MTKKAVVIKLIGIVIDGSLNKIEPMPGTAEAIKRLSQEFDVHLYSEFSKYVLPRWLHEVGLIKNITSFFGNGGGSIGEYLDALFGMDYEIILYISDKPEDFIVDHKGLIKVAVNAFPNNVFPGDVYAYKQSLTTDLIEQFMEG